MLCSILLWPLAPALALAQAPLRLEEYMDLSRAAFGKLELILNHRNAGMYLNWDC